MYRSVDYEYVIIIKTKLGKVHIRTWYMWWTTGHIYIKTLQYYIAKYFTLYYESLRHLNLYGN
jgi:hypothetical protein